LTNDPNGAFEEVADELAYSHATRGKMFGMPCLNIGKKAFAGFHDNAMVFKLHGDDHSRALALTGAHLFDPMGQRPMKEWVVVPVEHSGKWSEIGKQALTYVQESNAPESR
jgi:hypothetical protein